MWPGYGFAEVVSQTGLPQTLFPIALAMFSVGAQIGQLVFVIGVLGLAAVYNQLLTEPPRVVVASGGLRVRNDRGIPDN